MTRKEAGTTLSLGMLVVASAVIAVEAKHENRRLMSELEQLRSEVAQLETEWSQLQLEEATLAHHGRVEQIARDDLEMTEPADPVVLPVKSRP